MQRGSMIWYGKRLGFRRADSDAIVFEWRNTDNSSQKNYTVWAPFEDSTKYFEPSQKEYVINLRVENLEAPWKN